MTISYTGVSQIIRASEILYPKEDTIKAIAQAAMVSMAEADAEMLLDAPGEYSTREAAERVFQGLNDQATDLVEDMFDELKQRVLDELAKKAYTARVSALHYDDRGDLEEVDVKIVFE